MHHIGRVYSLGELGLGYLKADQIVGLGASGRLKVLVELFDTHRKLFLALDIDDTQAVLAAHDRLDFGQIYFVAFGHGKAEAILGLDEERFVKAVLLEIVQCEEATMRHFSDHVVLESARILTG